MSFFDATFMIGYSRPEYEPMYVKRIFDTIFGVGVVEQVREFVITPPDGRTYKKFYIYTFDDSHPACMRLTDLINDYKFAAVVYKNEWDKKSRKVVDRYWKVFFAPVLKTFTPYLMNEGQLAVAFPTIDPWSPEADPAFACTLCGETLELPPPMVRDETAHLGRPCKLERSTNAEEREVTEEEKADVSKDFDELAAAIEKYGEDFSGSIAPKIPRPPPLTRATTNTAPPPLTPRNY